MYGITPQNALKTKDPAFSPTATTSILNNKQAAKPTTPLLGIRLWSDWNTQVYKWAEVYSKKLHGQVGKTFGYLVVHTEDVVSQDVAVRFAGKS